VAHVSEAKKESRQEEETVNSIEVMAVTDEGTRLPSWNPADYRKDECRHELRPEWCAICSPRKTERDAS
jgi:hypothetical protein